MTIEWLEAAPGCFIGVRMRLAWKRSSWRYRQDDDWAVAPPFPRPAASLAGCWLLLADDCAPNRVIVMHLLENAGACVEVAEDGEEAIAKVSVRIEQGASYDLILMDLNMPRVDGFEATRKIRDCGYEGPIVATTAYGDSSQHDGARRAGCDLVIVKPFDPKSFLEVVTAMTHGNEAGCRVHGGQIPEVSNIPDVITSEHAGDEEMLALVEWFVEEVEDDAVAIESALVEGDFEQIQALSHRLKGAGGNYGFPSLTSVASVVEKRAATNDPRLADGAVVLVTVLRRLCAG